MKIWVTRSDGTTTTISGRERQSLMEALRDAGIEEVLALCGGCCACATCHVHVADEFLGLLPPMDTPESELLEGSPKRKPASRLSCQILLHEALDGIAVTVAPEDY